jgi:DNA-binding transcriptional MerR regulator|uniref:Replisome organizer n=1 Tax=virus sp. ctyMK1 TaxID=2828002 RepID=A0A8S5RFH5_9VIRU|nr:MAG TPA: replisome organizer [virus sp. ctyMK1]
MSNLNGFVKLHRKMIEWGWYSDCVVKDVFLHILMVATFKPAQYRGYDLVPGQAIIGLSRLSKELGFSIQQVRTALKKLESTGEISLFSTNKFTIATVENWEFYQCEDETNNKRATNEQQTNNKRATNEQQHLKNVKNVKNVKKVKNNIFKPPTAEEVKAYCIERGNNVDVDAFIDFYESKGWYVGKNKMKDWKAAVRNWERNRASKSVQSKEGRLDWIDGI